MNNSFSKFALWAIFIIVLFTVFRQYDDRGPYSSAVSYSQFMEDAKNGKVQSVVIQGNTLSVTQSDGSQYELTSPSD